jgi:hypothetical protein
VSEIKITHTHADGTLIEGSRKGDGVYDVLRGLRDNWRYFPSIRQIGLGQSRDKAAMTHRINRAAEALRAAGHEVETEIDDTQRRTVAEIEADRAERAEARAERYEERAERRGTQANADYERARQMGEAIPFGQPILVGHHSEGRDRRYRDRMNRTYDRAFTGMNEAEELGRRAESAQATQSYRESVPTTLRRIEKLEAEERTWQRVLDGKPDGHTRRTADGGYRPAEGTHRARVEAALAGIREQLTYWREHVAKRQADGVKVWSREDFTKGDYVRFLGTWYEVLRVNAKSVTIPAMINDGPIVHKDGNRCTWTDTVPYHKVKGRKSAEEIAAIIAEADQREAQQSA